MVIKVKTERWDEGLPLGNGKTGSIVYGSSPLKITVDRTDLWDTRPNETTLEKGFTFKNLEKLSLSGDESDWAERARLFEKIFSGTPYPSKITAGRLELEFYPKAQNVHYSLNTANALVTVYDGDEKIADIFTDYVTLVGVIRTYRKCDFSFHIPAYLSGEATDGSGIGNDKGVTLGYPKAADMHDG
ncbi:MAG: glycoside hydrolase N-terminal domain-containing protein, partial [Candidatus Borkfalkiaceae bacterium]|nr:glycoside hydrolase N-terminal domain-containing protein [Christensenellaceae bacterium]